MFLLDTDHITIIQDQTQPEFGRLSQRMASHPPTAFYVSIVSFHEQVAGAQSYLGRARTMADLVNGYRLLEKVRRTYLTAQVLLFDSPDAARAAQLRGQRVRIGPMDLRIASTALSQQLTVLTRNLRDFRQVPGLNVEDWTQ